ncbi:hypothetical protein C5B94_03430 [Clavibacter michiganensis]|nr:hypothetical protein C5B94_03430 [Clavibacter michiganensis]
MRGSGAVASIEARSYTRPMEQGTRTDRAGTPPRFVDPRRIGALAGLVGAATFVFSYAGGLDDAAAVAVKVLVVVIVVATLGMLFVRPRGLGPFVPPSRVAIGVYLLCVVGELALIRVGTDALVDAGRDELRPALIVLVVGLHFLPFAWAFHERMFTWLGAMLVALGAVGLLTAAAELVAVIAGLAMGGMLLAYALGLFARRAG